MQITEKNITCSLIICTRNRPSDILSCLLSVKNQTKIPDEIIIVDSSDLPLLKFKAFETLFSQDQFPGTNVIYEHSKPGLTYQRNIGIKLATKEIIHFIDDDTILKPDYIQKMDETFLKYPNYVGGMGTITNIPVPTRYSWYRLVSCFFLLPRDYSSGKFTLSGMPTHAYGTKKLKTVQVLGGCCMSYRAKVFTQHLFDEKLPRYGFMEDCDFSRRVSYDSPLFYNANAQLAHNPSPANRDGIIDNRAMFIKNYSYLFFKNFYPKNKLKIIAYGWSITGLFFQAVLTRNKDYLKGYYKGLKEFYKC